MSKQELRTKVYARYHLLPLKFNGPLELHGPLWGAMEDQVVYSGTEQARGETEQLRFSVWVSGGIAPVSDWRSAALLN